MAIASPQTRHRARATEHFSRFLVVVPGTEPPSHDLHGVLHPQKKMMVMAEQWAQHDEAVKARILKEDKWDLIKPQEQLDFFCSCYYYHHSV